MAATPTTATATATGVLTAFTATSTAQWKPMRPRPTAIPYTLGAVTALFVIASLFIGARLVIEIRSGSLSKGTACRRVSLWAVMASYVLYMAVFGMTIYTQNGTMQTQERGKPPCVEDFQKWAKVSFARILCGYTSVWLVKGSFVAMYFGITKAMPSHLRIVLYLSAGYVLASYLVTMLTLILWCGTPAEIWRVDFEYWKAHRGVSRCNSLDYFNFPEPLYITTAMAATSDFLVITVPFLLLRFVATKRREKLALVFLVFLGIISFMTSILKASWLTAKKSDKSWTNYSLGVSSVLTMTEVASALIAVSLPALRVVVIKRWRKRKQSKQSSGNDEAGVPKSDPDDWARNQACPGRTTIMEMDSMCLGSVSEEALHSRIQVGKSPIIIAKSKPWIIGTRRS